MENRVNIKEEPLDLDIDDDGAEIQKMAANQDAELDDVFDEFEIIDEQPDIITINAAVLLSDDERRSMANSLNNFLNKMSNNGAELKWYCKQCHRKFGSFFQYKYHFVQWNCGSGTRFLQCPVCPLRFPSAEKRKPHLDLHRRNRFFCKQYCGIDFETIEQCEKHEYVDHMLLNSNCRICGYLFHSFDALIHHQQHAHGEMQQYVCSYCRLCFSTSALLAAHWRAKVKTCGLLMNNVVPHTYTRQDVVRQYKPKATSTVTSSAPLAKPTLKICDTYKRVRQEMDDSNDLSSPSPKTIAPKTFAPIKTHPSEGLNMSAKNSVVNTKFPPSILYKMIPVKAVKLAPNEKIISLPIQSPGPLLKQSPAPPINQTTPVMNEDSLRRKALLSNEAIKYIEGIPEKQRLINNIKEKFAKAQKGEISIDTQLAELAKQSDDTPLATKRRKVDTKNSLDDPPLIFLKLRDYPELRQMSQVYRGYRFYWLCPNCSRRYELKHPFRQHLLRVHDISLTDSDNMLFEVFQEKISPHLAINEAAQTFKTIPLMQPMKKHVCQHCGRRCSSQMMLDDHMRNNCSHEPLYFCNVCNRKYSSAETLRYHNYIHTNQFPFSCNYCNKRFRSNGQVTVHHRTHTGVRPFVCEVCKHSFTRRETLISHLSRHIGMKRYNCYGCFKQFSCISGLTTHRNSRPDTCGQVPLDTRAVGPRVRVKRGNVLFEPEPQLNAHRRSARGPGRNTKSTE